MHTERGSTNANGRILNYYFIYVKRGSTENE